MSRRGAVLVASALVGATIFAIARFVPRPTAQGTHPADPFAWGALVSGALQLSVDYIGFGLIHVAYLAGLAVLGASLLTAMSSVTSYHDGRVVGLFAGLATSITGLIAVGSSGGLTRLLFGLPLVVAETVFVVWLTSRFTMLGRKLYG